MTRSTPSLALLGAALALAACDSVRPVAAEGGDLSACAGCHGDAAREGEPLVRAAPPASALGGAAGAHLAHLTGSAFRAPLACAECHDVPALVDHADGVVQVPMAGLARAGDATPSWNPGSATCSGVYCHGATLGGGPAATPAWSSTAALGCTSCHGAPPPAPHAASTSCEDCHAGYTATSVNAATHLDGTVDGGGHEAGWSDPAVHGHAVNAGGLASCKGCHGTGLDGGTSGVSCDSCHGGTAWRTSCTFCHGTSPSGPASPPVDTQGRTAATNVSVGVHASHVGTTISAPLACTQCHPDRAGSDVVTDAAHVDGDGVAEVVLGTLAKTGGAPATYARASATSATCASTYCHGRFSGGANSGSGATVGWTSTAQVSCTSCHAMAPSTGEHSRHTSRFGCNICHNAVVTSTNGFVDATLHVNGVDNVNFGGTYNSRAVTGTWNVSSRSCSSLSCHGGETW